MNPDEPIKCVDCGKVNANLPRLCRHKAHCDEAKICRACHTNVSEYKALKVWSKQQREKKEEVPEDSEGVGMGGYVAPEVETIVPKYMTELFEFNPDDHYNGLPTGRIKHILSSYGFPLNQQKLKKILVNGLGLQPNKHIPYNGKRLRGYEGIKEKEYTH